MKQVDIVNAQIQRGLMRCTIRPDGAITVEPTEEGEIAVKVLSRKGTMRCMKCNAPHPTPGLLPKYSVCPDCRKGTMPTVDFIERP